MDTLDAAAAAQVASWLLDERDLASLRCTSRFWRDALADDPGLWSQLVARRFGAALPSKGAAAAGGGASASAALAGAADPERRFRQLAAAALRRPVAGLERLIWLDGNHLQVRTSCQWHGLDTRQSSRVALACLAASQPSHAHAPSHPLQRVDDPSSPYGTTLRVASVWWLELGGRLHGVLPGRYRLAWRLRLEVSPQPLVSQQPAEWQSNQLKCSCHPILRCAPCDCCSSPRTCRSLAPPWNGCA